MPSMQKFNHSPSLATGTIAGGTLGIMIPPSVPLVIYGLVTQQDIVAFLAGIVPGLLLGLSFLVVVGPGRVWTKMRHLSTRMVSTGHRSDIR